MNQCEHGCNGCENCIDDCTDCEERPMTQQAQAEALRLADTLDLLAMDMKTPRAAAAELRRLHARVQEQQKSMKANQIELGEQDAKLQKINADLVAEASRTAAEKLRADQMSQQHDHQAAMNREARAMLAAAPTPPALERKPLTEDQILEVLQLTSPKPSRLVVRLVRAIERAHGIGATNAD